MSKFDFKLDNVVVSVEAANLDEAKTLINGMTIDLNKFVLQEKRTALYEIPGSCGSE